MEYGNQKTSSRPRRRRGGVLRRLWRWSGGEWLFGLVGRLYYALYDWWFPRSDHPEGYGYHGYSRSARQNRIKWLWRRFRRFLRRSPLGSLSRALQVRWYDWWYPVSDDVPAYAYPGYQGRVRRNRLVRDWRRFKRRLARSFLGRWLDAVANRWYDWWYPAGEPTDPHATYSRRGQNRISRAWRRLSHWGRKSWLGEKLTVCQNRLYEWYFPSVKVSGYGYGYGYGKASYVRMNRPEWFIRHYFHKLRRTWLGRKLGWILDELETAAVAVRARAAHDFAWPRVRAWLFRWQTIAMLVLIGAGTVYGYIYGLPRYNQFLEQTYARQAKFFLAKQDVSRALLRARQVLAKNPDNLDAIQIMAELADYFDPPHAIHWRQRLVSLNPDPTNRLALAKTAMRGEAFPFPTATKALNEVEPAFRQTSMYHLVAGALAIKMSDLRSAEHHYAEAVRLNPDDPVNRMSLAVVRLQSTDPKFIADSRTTLELLRTDRQLGLLATRSLMAESISRRDFAQAEALSQQILTNAQASFSDRIVHLAILNAEKSPSFQEFLAEVQKQAEEHPFYVGELGSWMIRYGLAEAALNWLNGLPPNLTQRGLVPLVISDAYAALGKWEDMTSFLHRERWAELDAVRVGLMSFAAWKRFGDKSGNTIWQQAIGLAARSPATLKTLAEMAASWNWKDETADVLWYAAGRYAEEQWPLETLKRLYTGERDTIGLRRVFRAMVQKNPKDALALNNLAMVSLLLRKDLPEAEKQAADLHGADPSNPVFASTYAFSLYLQGRVKEAAETLRGLGLDRLDDPSLAAYYGIFLVASGERQTAQTYLSKSAKAFLLPEELAMVEKARKSL